MNRQDKEWLAEAILEVVVIFLLAIALPAVIIFVGLAISPLTVILGGSVLAGIAVLWALKVKFID